jgi:hypothetical protein
LHAVFAFSCIVATVWTVHKILHIIDNEQAVSISNVHHKG